MPWEQLRTTYPSRAILKRPVRRLWEFGRAGSNRVTGMHDDRIGEREGKREREREREKEKEEDGSGFSVERKR